MGKALPFRDCGFTGEANPTLSLAIDFSGQSYIPGVLRMMYNTIMHDQRQVFCFIRLPEEWCIICWSIISGEMLVESAAVDCVSIWLSGSRIQGRLLPTFRLSNLEQEYIQCSN